LEGETVLIPLPEEMKKFGKLLLSFLKIQNSR
jgi:hypothetical protein